MLCQRLVIIPTLNHCRYVLTRTEHDASFASAYKLLTLTCAVVTIQTLTFLPNVTGHDILAHRCMYLFRWHMYNKRYELFCKKFITPALEVQSSPPNHPNSSSSVWPLKLIRKKHWGNRGVISLTTWARMYLFYTRVWVIFLSLGKIKDDFHEIMLSLLWYR